MSEDTRDIRKPDRPTQRIPAEVLRALLQETRTEDEQRVAEWVEDERTKQGG